MHQFRKIGLATFLLGATGLSIGATAQGVCVECVGPDQTYRCSIKDSDKVQGMRGAGRAIDYVCMTEIARAGGHSRCRVGNKFSGPCIGQPFDIDITKVALPPQPTEPDSTTPGQPKSEQAATPPPPSPQSAPPQTLEELARRTVSNTKEQISAADEKVKQAGGAVKGGLQKTWDCVASLFSRC